jgi:predicted RNA polymerase sigma factor
VSDELEKLYQSTYTAVVRFLYRKVWDAERAEDLAQEVFVRALAHRPDKPRAWVFAVAANLARDEARAAVRRKRHLTLLKGDPIAQPTVSPSADDSVEHDEASRPRDPPALGCRPELPGDRGTDGTGGGSGWHDTGTGAAAPGGRARSTAEPVEARG